MPVRFVVLCVVLGALLLAPPASAALPAKGKSFEAHDHETPGRNWHVQFEIDARSSRKVETLVVYSEACDETVAEGDVPISEAGGVAAGGKLKGGTWRVDATFTAPDAIEGTFRVTKGGCDTGVLPFRITPAGDGHDHGPGAIHNHGPKFPDLARATVTHTRQAIQMRRRVIAAADDRFPTYAAARRLNYKRFTSVGKRPRPLIFHLRKAAYEDDDRIFDARRPESLVYWWPAEGEPILLGSMFRAPAGTRPAYAGPIPIYHVHGNRYGETGATQMTHVWLTGELRSAWSNCLPVAQLEALNPAFRYTTPASPGSGPESAPCDLPAG